MQTEVRFICDSPAEAAALLAQLVPGPSVASAPLAEKPKRGRKAVATTEPAAASTANVAQPVDTSNLLGLGAAPATPATPAPGSLDALLLGTGNSAGQLPPAATPQPAAPALTQQNVIQAFVALGQAPGKGPDAIREVLTALGASTVVAVPQAKWAEAIQLVRQKLA